MFDMRCFHSSLNGGPNRRMCTIVYYNNPRREAEEKATRERHGRCTQTEAEDLRTQRRWLGAEGVLDPAHGGARVPRRRLGGRAGSALILLKQLEPEPARGPL